MRTFILAAAGILVATSASRAEGGFNPGTVVGNVYEPLNAHGCDQGFGFSPRGCNDGGLAPTHRCDRQADKDWLYDDNCTETPSSHRRRD